MPSPRSRPSCSAPHLVARPAALEGIADLLRVLGDLTAAEIAARLTAPEDTTVGALLAELEAARRALLVRIAGEERWVAVEDAGRLRDALGVAMPVGVPDAFLEPVSDPFGDLVSRFARTRGPFVAADVAARYGLGTSPRHRRARPARRQGSPPVGRVPARRFGSGVV